MFLFRKKKNEPAPAVVPTEVPDGMSGVRVYTYDGRPLSGIEGDFALTLISGTHEMKSIYTGTRITSDFVVTYNGSIVGALSESKNGKLLCAVRDKLGPLSLHATIEGVADGGWPLVEVSFDRNWALQNSQ